MSEAESIEKLKSEVSAIESELIAHNFLTEKEKACLELLTSEKDIETEDTSDPVCPCCGFVDVDWYDGLDSKGDGDEWIAECPLCDTPYTCRIELRTAFTTKRYEEEEEQLV
jgi:hypothetical protein